MDESGCPYLGVPLFISPHSPVRHFFFEIKIVLIISQKKQKKKKNRRLTEAKKRNVNDSKYSTAWAADAEKNQWSVRVVYFSLASLRSALK